MPAVGLSYLVFGVFIAIVALFAKPAVATEMWNAPQLPAEVVFIPLLAAWAIWVGLAVSSLVSDTRVAQQFSVLASLPAIALVALMSFRILTPSLGLAVVLALALLAIDCGACFVVAGLFDRERLVTGHQAVPAHRRPRHRAAAAAGQAIGRNIMSATLTLTRTRFGIGIGPWIDNRAGEWQVIVDGTVAG